MEASQVTGTFRLMDLPVELRELVYLFAAGPLPPIDTASIKNTPDRTRVPSIAQLDRATRDEALAILYRNRELHISLHCQRNLHRATDWLSTIPGTMQFSNSVVFSGVLRPRFHNSFFYFNIVRDKRTSHFSVITRRAATHSAEEKCKQIKSELTRYLERQEELQDEHGDPRQLTKANVQQMLALVGGMSGWSVAARLPQAPESVWVREVD